MSKTIIGWKLYYGDGSIVTSKDTDWAKAQSENVQVLIVYYQETYKIWHNDHWDIEPYRNVYFGKDYYWQFGNGQACDVPSGMGGVKKGSEIDNLVWQNLYMKAFLDVSF